MLTRHIVDLILDLTELHDFGLHIFQCFHFVSDEMAITVREHTEEDALESEAFSPFFADW